MALFKIFKGVKPELPRERKEGYAYITEDQNEFYVDISNEKRIRIGDVIQVSTEIRLALVTPLDKLYLDTDELEFYKYVNGEWKKVGLKELPEIGESGQVLKKTSDSVEWANNDSIIETLGQKNTQLSIEQVLLNGLDKFTIEFTEETGEDTSLIEQHNTDPNAHNSMGWITSDNSELSEPIPIDADSLGGVPAEQYSTKEYIDNLIGNINSLLDNINGEVI